MRLLVAAILLTTAQTVVAQSPDLHRAGLPRDEARRLQTLIEDPETRRYEGDTTIDAFDVIEGNVFVTDGVLRLAGKVRGHLIVMDGDVIFMEGASVDGDVTVVGGSVQGTDVARLAGTLTEYGEGFGLLARANRYHDGRGDWRDRWAARDWHDDDDDWGGANVIVGVRPNYNRVEGLPVQIGPAIRTGGPFPTRIEAMAVWRTDVGPLTDTERMGYFLRGEQFFDRHGVFRVGGTLRSTVDPIESWSLSDLEASLASAVFHEDQRDYFEREGWSAYIRVSPRHTDLDLTLEYRDETHRTLASRDPWTLFDSDKPWRDQPLVADGDVRLGSASVLWDSRRGDDFALRGWFARAELLHGFEGSLALPAAPAGGTAPAFDTNFTTGLIDFRRYATAGRAGSFAFRAVAGGSLNDNPIAPQFQHALGGAGSLPGYELMSADCGARSISVLHSIRSGSTPVPFFGSYGCDRFALFQAEYRGGLDFHFGHDDFDDDKWHIDTGVDWTVFFDAARGWALGDDPARSNTGTLYDVGAGVILGGLGVYGAVPLTGEDRGLRVFVRLGPRF